MRVQPAALLSLGLLSALGPAMLAPAAQVPEGELPPALESTLSVGPIALPEKGRGRRDVLHAFGKKRASEELRAALEEAFRSRRSFAEILEDGADHRLDVAFLDVRTVSKALESWQSSGGRVTVEATAHVAWTGPGIPAHEAELEVGARLDTPDRPSRADIRRAWDRLLDDLAARAFASGGRAGAFGPLSESTWIAPPG